MVDRTRGTRIAHSGVDALDLLHRLTTNELLSLNAGQARSTVITTDQGRILAVLQVAVRAQNELLLLCESADPHPIMQWIDRYTIIEDATMEDESGSTAQFSVIGPEAAAVTERVFGISPGDGEHARVSLGAADVEIVGNDWPGMPKLDVISGLADAAAVWQGLVEGGVRPSGDNAFHEARVRHGIPFHGSELTDRFNPLEAGMTPLVSFTKGCYIGQEVIARLDSYDKLQRRLMMLRSDVPLMSGAMLESQGKRAGEVTSAGTLRDEAGYPALGYVRRGHWEPGTELMCGDTAVTVLIPANGQPAA